MIKEFSCRLHWKVLQEPSFRQKLDPISKNMRRRQNPIEFVFEDISTFDAENPIVVS